MAKTKIKILLVFGDLSVGGLQNTMLDIIRNADKDRFEFGVCEMSSVPGPLAKEVASWGVEVYQCPLRKNIFHFNRQLKDILSQNNYDGVHVCREYLSWIVTRSALQLNLPVRIVNYQSAIKFTKLSMMNLMIHFGALMTYVYANKIVGCSSFCLKHNMGQGILKSAKARPINNSFESEKFDVSEDRVRKVKKEFGIDDGRLVIGACGRMHPVKRPSGFIKIAAKVCKQLPQAIFLWVGGGDLQSEMEEMVVEYGLQDNVIITGMRDDVPELLNCMDIYLQLSVWEGFCIAVAEAQYCRLPVIASNAEAFAESVCPQMQPYRVGEDLVNDCVEKVMTLALDAELREKLGECGREFASQFDVKNIVAQFESVYQELYDNRN